MFAEASYYDEVVARHSAEFDREPLRLGPQKFIALMQGKSMPAEPPPAHVSDDTSFFINSLCNIIGRNAGSKQVRNELFGQPLPLGKYDDVEQTLETTIDAITKDHNVAGFVSPPTPENRAHSNLCTALRLMTNRSDGRRVHHVFEGADHGVMGVVTLYDHSIYSSTKVEATVPGMDSHSFKRAFAGAPFSNFFAPRHVQGIRNWGTYCQDSVCIAAGQTDSGLGRDHHACTYVALMSNDQTYVALQLDDRNV